MLGDVSDELATIQVDWAVNKTNVAGARGVDGGFLGFYSADVD